MRELHNTWYTYLYGVGIKLTYDIELIEENIHDTLIIYSESYDETRSKPITFLTRVMMNNIIKQLERRNKLILIEEFPTSEYNTQYQFQNWEDSEDWEDLEDNKNKLKLIKDNLYILNDTNRDIFNKYYFDLYSLDELVQEFNLNLSNVKNRLHHSKKKIKKQIENIEENKKTIKKDKNFILTPQTREIYNKYYIDGYNLDMLCEEYSTNIITMKARLARANKKLKENIENNQ